MPDDIDKTVRIRRKPKIKTDERGRSVWAEPVETEELELVSTTMLTKILSSDDEKARKRIADAAEGKDGVLAHDAQKNTFEIIDDDDLRAALESADSTPQLERLADVVLEPVSPKSEDDDEEELSLVSTQMLRRILAGDDPESNLDPGEPEDTGGGFDPYDHS